MKPSRFSNRFSRGAANVLLATCWFAAAPIPCASAADPAFAGQNNPLRAREPDRIWVGPMPFECGKGPQTCRTLRNDWIPTLTNASEWQSVLERSNVLKIYIMVLPDAPAPGKAIQELSDSQLERLAKFARDHHLKMAIEVGGLRTSTSICGDQAGETFAQSELVHLRRWLKVGGRIDYITTDHAVMMNMRGIDFAGPGLNQNRKCKMSVSELTDELTDYFLTLQRAIPTAKFGVIESLGYFQVRGTNGISYAQSDPMLPTFPFDEYFDHLIAAMKHRQLELDHFHIDFGFGGVSYDGRQRHTGKLDFGRVLAVEEYVQSKGVKAGVIFNATLDDAFTMGERIPANREMYRRTMQYFEEYIAAGGKANQLIFQTWDHYPDSTGPESESYSFFNTVKAGLSSEVKSNGATRP